MEYYEQTSEGYNELHGEEQRQKMERIRSHLELKENNFLLDVGCGTGISSDFDCFVVSIDPTIGLLKQNKNNNKIQGFGEHLPFKDRVFDVVVCITALHNFSDIERGIIEIQRVGKDRFVFSILKKAQSFGTISRKLHEVFIVEKMVDAAQDTIFFCRKR